MLLNGDPQTNSLLVEPFVWYFYWGYSCRAWPFPFPGALPSNLLVLLKPNGIEFLSNFSFQLLP